MFICVFMLIVGDGSWDTKRINNAHSVRYFSIFVLRTTKFVPYQFTVHQNTVIYDIQVRVVPILYSTVVGM